MAKKDSISTAGVASAPPLSQPGDAVLQWDSSSGLCRAVRLHAVSAQGPQSFFQATGPPATAPRARSYWTTGEIGRVPGLSPSAVAWAQEAALVTFSLDPFLLAATTHVGIPGATGELVWVHWPAQPESSPSSVSPLLLVHAAYDSLPAERVTIVPSLHVHDPLISHSALVLQAVLEAESGAGQLYAASLADALAVHFLRRYAASRPARSEGSGGLSPHTLQRTLAYIQAHLAQALSLAELAAVGQTSRAHFARMFKQATGLAPHQYVIRCRMAEAQRLLAQTDLPLSEVALQVGCVDHSHFTALFRAHVTLTPTAYRDKTRSEHV
jgi:AraC-like DNA-binding protein